MLDLPPEEVPLSTERRNRQLTRLVAADDAIGLCSPRIQVDGSLKLSVGHVHFQFTRQTLHTTEYQVKQAPSCSRAVCCPLCRAC
jgi:hypothetical protein